MDVFGRYIAIILTVILILIFPLQYIAQGQSENIDSIVCTHATEFAETIRHQGYISLDMYENLVDELHLTQERYEIEMEVAHPIAGKEMAFDQLGDEILDLTVQKTSAIDKSSISASSKKGYSLSDDTISSFAAHTHTDNCYSGHRHTSSCYVPHTHKYLQYYGDGTTGVPYYYRYNIFIEIMNTGISSYCWVPKLYTFNYVHNTYGYTYGVTYRAEITANGTEQFVFQSYTANSWNYPVPPSFPQILNLYQLSQLRNKSDFNTFWIRATGDDISFNNYELELNVSEGLDLCNTTPDFPYKLVCGQVQDETPDCSSVITGIVANYPNQEVVKGNAINTTVTATYLDGHTASITCTSNFNPNTIGTQTVTLTTPYGLINTAKTSGTKTCTISVNVKAAAKSCTAGLGHPDYVSSLSVCPVCKAIASITASNQSFAYDGNHHELTITSSIGADITTAYDTDPGEGESWTWNRGPTSVGVYPVYLYVRVQNTITGVIESFYAFQRTLTIYKVASSLVANLSKTTINKGDPFPITSVKVNYNDGTSATFISGWTITGFNTNTIGVQNVTVSYGGLSTVVQITVNKVATGITANLSKTTIYKGEAFPISSVSIAYNDGSTSNVTTGWTITGFNTNTIGVQNVTVTYGGLSTVVQITVKGNLSSITATPATQSIAKYTNPTFTVTARYADGLQKNVTGFAISGLNNKVVGTQSITISYTEGGITCTTTASVIVKLLTRTCPICHTTYNLTSDDKDPGCPVCKTAISYIQVSPTHLELQVGDPLQLEVKAIYQNGEIASVLGWTNNYDPTLLGLQTVTVTYQGFTATVTVNIDNNYKVCPVCGLEYALSDDGTDPGCPICSKLVTSITAAPRVVTIERHQELPITVRATYRDGHIEDITDWSSNLDPSAIGTHDVNIYYQDAIDQIKVTVLEEGMEQCPICGLKYRFQDSPRGCPLCSTTIVGIEASLRSGGNQVLHGTEIKLEIVLIYKDNHRELTYTGWTITGYQPEVLGVQTITVHYGSFTTNLIIEVVENRALVICPNGHEYYLNDDGTDPGCPYCSAAAGIENAIFQVDITYTGEILERLYSNGIYHLTEGDYFTVTIIPKHTSVRGKLQKMFFSLMVAGRKEIYTFGGEVS